MRMKQRSGLRCLALAMAVALAAPVARAQPAQPAQLSSAETKVHFQRAVKLYAEEDYRGALVEFKRAYELSSNNAILYNIGQTHFQLRDYASALAAFEKYLASATSIAAARRADVERDLEDLRGRIAKVTVEISAPGATVSVDDVAVGKSPLPAALTVSAGVRKFTAAKEGLPSITKTVELAGGDKATVKLEFPAPVVVAPPAPAVREVPVEPRRTHPLVYVGFGVAAVGVGVGATFGILALGTKSDLDARCPDRVCPTDAQSKGDALSTQATVSTIGLGVGLVGALVGTYFLVFPGGPASTSRAAAALPPASPRPRVAPWFAGTAGGLEGSF
jgi:hypothetical protein